MNTSASIVRPQHEDELREIICAAIADARALEIRGGGTHRDVGAPNRDRTIVELSALRGVIDYQPGELTLTARAATPLAEIEMLLRQHGQMLAFEPVDYAPIFSRSSAAATLGGIIGAGIAGPRRISAGGARDHVLGFAGISGRGEHFKGGGKVVKNVTGFDVSKLMAGSWGQFAVLTELTLRVAPRPHTTKTLAFYDLAPAGAIAAMTEAMSSTASVAAAVHAPSDSGGQSITALRLEGFHPSVEARTAGLTGTLSRFGAVTPLADEDAEMFWTSVREARPVAEHETLWRVHVAPSRALEVAREIKLYGGSCLYDWAGALVWAGAPSTANVRLAAQSAGGHAMLVRAPLVMRHTMPARQAETEAIAKLNASVKHAFDPFNILDPHRFN